ncbi:hypothetical protein ILUMI_19796 [Ignelater luminosus]|uniref:Uncharacterized protein n=1 Tax=Ignelater luminosus TaxID=2038154 RepID=A0A8K0G2V6_IGNLU|nr:hypothetical protein ILUMI_19796 [Ignelater luminosus]
MLTLPPHTSNKLQLPDKLSLAPSKKFVANGIDSWLLENSNQTMGMFALPRICSSSCDRAASSQNIKSGFCATGISPFDPDIFKDIDFMSSFISDRETHPVTSTSAGVATVSTANHSAQALKRATFRWPRLQPLPFQLNLAWKIR